MNKQSDLNFKSVLREIREGRMDDRSTGFLFKIYVDNLSSEERLKFKELVSI